MNAILNPKRTWPLPTVPGLGQSYVAWQHIVSFFLVEPYAAASSVTDSWWSRLIQRHALMAYQFSHRFYLNLFTGHWGCIAAAVQLVADGVYQLCVCRASTAVVYSCAMDDWSVAHADSSFLDSKGVVLSSSHWQTPLQVA